MKSPQQWKELLTNINFPNFNKSNDEEVLEFVFSNCKQRDALLTWMVIQLGADFDIRILKHEDIVKYLKKRRIAEKSKITAFVEASLPRFDQEVIWDKLFSYIKIQKRLIPQPYEGIQPTEPPDFDDTAYNEKFHDLSAKENMEPLFKELSVFKNLRKIKDEEAKERLGEKTFETKDENTENEKHGDFLISEKDKKRSDDSKDVKQIEKNIGEGDASSSRTLIPTEKTTGGTWYSTPDGRQKIFVPVGAPPLGEFKFDSKTMKVVYEEEGTNNEKEIKFAQKMEDLEKKFKKIMREIND